MATSGDVRTALSPRLTESGASQWEQSPRLRQIKMKLHKFREYVRIYLLSNVEVTRDNSVYVSVTKNNAPERPYMMHKVCKQATHLQVYDYFLKEPRPMPLEDHNNVGDQDINSYFDNYNAYPSNSDEDSESDKSSESGVFGVYTDNMMLPLNKKRTLKRVRSINNKNVYFRFRFKCLHRKQKGYSSEMTEFGENQYQFPLKFSSIFVIANITEEQASTLDVDAGRPGYIPVVHLFNHWLNDLQILPFNHVITFVNDIITTSADVDELILDSASIHMIVTKTLASIKRTWDKYPDDENIQSTNKHYGHNASYQSNLSEDPYELRNRNNKKNDISLLNMFDKTKAVNKDKKGEKEDTDRQQINELKKILFRKFLFLFIIASKIDYHHIRQNKKEKKNKGKGKKNHKVDEHYQRVFDCSLLYWFVRSIYFYQRASIPYILALFRDECDIMGLNILWEAIQINVKCCSDFETFLYLAPFINFFDAIDCFLRSSDQKRSIQSPEILKSNQRTQRTARLVLKMIEIDLSLPVPSNRRFPVEGILLAKMSKRSQHQTEFINLLNTIQKTISYWDEKEKVQYLTSMFQRHHSTISRILDWNWMIHDHYYSFCQSNEVLQIGIATQEHNLATKMKTLTREQFNDRIFRGFVEKWYESIFNQQVTDALMENNQIDTKTIRKFMHYKVRKSISTIMKSPSPQIGSMVKTGSMMATFGGISSKALFSLDSPQFGARVKSCSVASSNTHTVEWYVNIMLNETSDAIILMIENFVKQRKDALALSLLRYLLATDKHNNDIFDQLSILIANPHYYRLPTRFQQLLGKILSYIHWFPPKELNEIPPIEKMPSNMMFPGSPMRASWGNIADLPDSNKPTPLSLPTLLADLDHNRSNGSPNIAQSRTSITMEGGPLPSSLSPSIRSPTTALNMMNHNGPNPPQSVKSSTNINASHTIYQSRRIRPGSILDNKQQRRQRDREREKQRNRLIEVFGTENVPMSSTSSLNPLKLMDDEHHEIEEKSLSPTTDQMMIPMQSLHSTKSNVAVKAISPNAVEETEDDEDVILYFTTHVLTFEEKKEMMLWLNEYVISSHDIDLYAFWDFIFLNIIKLPDVLHISDYDSSLISDASQILSPKIHQTIKGHLDANDNEKKFNEMSQDPDESRIDLFLAYIMNEYEKINDKGTNIYKLNVLHNQITLIFEDLDEIIFFGLRSLEMVRLYQTSQKNQIMDACAHSSSSPPPPSLSAQQLQQQKLLFLTGIFKPWIASVMALLHKQLKSGHVLVKTLEYLANAAIIQKKLQHVLAFADMEFNDIDIVERLNVLKNLQNNIRETEYTDDLKQRIKQNIVQWDYLTLLQVDQLITTLLNDDTKAPTNLQVIDRVGNIIRLHWQPPHGGLEYVKYEISQQLCRKEGNDKEYLDPSTHLLGTFNVNTPPIQITLALNNLVIVPIKQEHNNDIVSKPVMATNCLLRIRGVTIKQEIKSAWSDAIDVVVCDTQNIEQNFSSYVENAQKSMAQNVDFYALQAMIDDGFNYEKTEIDAMSATLGKEIYELESLIQNAQNNLNNLQVQQNNVQIRNKSLPMIQDKCNGLLAKLNNIYTLSVQQLEDTVNNWTVDDCLKWFNRVGLCRFAKYHCVLQNNLTEKHVQNFLNFTIEDLHELGVGCNDNDNDCPRILHYINKCKKKYQSKLPQAEPLQIKPLNLPKPKPPGTSKRFPNPPSSSRSNTHPTNLSSASVQKRTNRTASSNSSMPSKPKKHPIHKTYSHPIPRPPIHKTSSVESMSSKEPSPGPLSPPRSPREQKQHYGNKWHSAGNLNIAQQRTNYQHPLSIYHQSPQNFSQRSVRSYTPNDFYNKQVPPPVGPPPIKTAKHIITRDHNPFENRNNTQMNPHIANNKVNANARPPPPFPTYLQYKQRAYNANNMYINGVLVPDDFVCPISGKLMEKPVMASDGRTYDRASMEKWLKTNDTSPVFIGQRLRNKFLMPYNELAARINAFKMQHSIQ